MEYSVGTSGAPPPSTRYRVPQSPWHSPVPYLFGGLAAMLGLIAFALLILACSYWKLSGYLDSGDNVDSGNDAEKCDPDVAKPPMVYEEKVVVIMAGEERPTFIATPMSSKAPPFLGPNDEKLKAVEEQVEDEEKANGSEPSDEENQRSQIN